MIDNYCVDAVRKEFPFFKKPYTFLDSASSAQKPYVVLQTASDLYASQYANVHRGLYDLSATMSEAYHLARHKILKFLGAEQKYSLIFTPGGATLALNFLARSLQRSHLLQRGDEIIISEIEHHANIVPWQMLKEDLGIVLHILPLHRDTGLLDLDAFHGLCSTRTRLLCVSHMSNVLGVVQDIESLVTLAHQKGIIVLVDGAQGVVHAERDLARMGCDFYIFSSHKLYSLGGVGVVCMANRWVDVLEPVFGGGDMIASVSWDRAIFKSGYEKFESGTPPFVEAIALGEAVDFISSLPVAAVRSHESYLLKMFVDFLSEISGVRLLPYGESIISFYVDGVHSQDLALCLAENSVCVRSGLLCAEPLVRALCPLGHSGGVLRVSLGLYNTVQDFENFRVAFLKSMRILKR